jgi:integrase
VQSSNVLRASRANSTHPTAAIHYAYRLPVRSCRSLVRHSKTDREWKGQEIAIPCGYRLRPVEAVQIWLDAAEITGPVFRSVAKGGRVLPAALTPHSVAAIVKAYARRAGLDPATYGGHSLRAGFLTTAAEHGANIFKTMEVSRHKSVDTLRGYVRQADLFRSMGSCGGATSE